MWIVIFLFVIHCTVKDMGIGPHIYVYLLQIGVWNYVFLLFIFCYIVYINCPFFYAFNEEIKSVYSLVALSQRCIFLVLLVGQILSFHLFARCHRLSILNNLVRPYAADNQSFIK